MMNVLVIGCNRLLKIKLTSLTAWSFVLLINLMSCPKLLMSFGTQLSYLFSLMILPLFECMILPATVLGVIIPGHFLSRPCALILRTSSNFLQFLSRLPGNIVFGKPSLTFVLMALFLAVMTETQKNGLKLWIVMFTCYCAMFLGYARIMV